MRKLFGGDAALVRSLKGRIQYIEGAATFQDLVTRPALHFHKLLGNLDGFYAIDVKSRKEKWRILLRPLDENEEPFEESIDKIAKIAEIVEIKEVSEHYE